MMLAILALAGAFLAPVVDAHMIMATPKPFNTPDNSPLSPSGSDYPCRGPATTKTVNSFKVGENQTLSFTGSATHGGGSCQLAVTLDTAPTKDSKFKVIHSIEGGCPLSSLSFPVPAELPNGVATMAWTWFNKIGNREMYMNCAAITVSGGASDKTGFDGLPDMALANVAVGTGASCTTPEGSDFTFKDPGKSVVRIGAGPFKELCGGASSGGTGVTQPSSGAGASPAAGNDGKYTPQGSQPVATQAPAVTSVPVATSSSPAVLASSVSSLNDAITSTIHTLVTVTTPTGVPTGNATTQVPSSPTLSAQPSDSAAPSVTAPAPGAGENTTCATNGEIVCNGETKFGLCDNGKVVWQSVAPGTKCSAGKIAKRDFTHRAQRYGF